MSSLVGHEIETNIHVLLDGPLTSPVASGHHLLSWLLIFFNSIILFPHLLLLSRDLSDQGLLQTPGGGHVGKGGGGIEGKGGKFLLPLPVPGPEDGVAGGVWCWKVLWGLGKGFIDGAPGSLYMFSESPSLFFRDPPGRVKSKVPKMGSLAFFSVSSCSSFEGGQK